MTEEPTAACAGCGRVILQNTARRMGGLCGPCRNTIQAKAIQAKWEPVRLRGLAPITPAEFEKIRTAADLEAACHFVFDKAHWKWTEHGEAALTTGERTVIAVETFFGETCNGGLLQFLLNESGAFARDLPASLMRVGLTGYVPLALELNRLFPAPVSHDPNERGDQVDALDDGEDVYIRANPGEFVSDLADV